MIQKPEEWAKITVEQLYRQLETVAANTPSVQVCRAAPPLPEGAVANPFKALPPKPKGDQGKSSGAPPKGVCFDFYQTGVCKRDSCNFRHEKRKPDGTKRPAEKKKPQAQKPTRTEAEHKGCSK